MMWSCWLPPTVTSGIHCGVLQPSGKQKPVDCSLQVGTECLPQVKEFKYLGVLFTSEDGAGDRQADRCGCSSKTGAAPDRLSEE